MRGNLMTGFNFGNGVILKSLSSVDTWFQLYCSISYTSLGNQFAISKIQPLVVLNTLISLNLKVSWPVSLTLSHAPHLWHLCTCWLRIRTLILCLTISNRWYIIFGMFSWRKHLSYSWWHSWTTMFSYPLKTGEDTINTCLTCTIGRLFLFSTYSPSFISLSTSMQLFGPTWVKPGFSLILHSSQS